MTDQPLVSIVTPSLNQGEFLEHTLLSVANQTYPHLEHLVLDGGSTDRTLELLRQYESRYALRWWSEPDGGQSHAVNKGFARARGAIIGWLNADDVYFTRDALESVVRTFRAAPDASVVYGDCVFMSRAGTVFRVSPATSAVTREDLQYHGIDQCAAFFQRRVVHAYSLRQDLHYLSDYEYWLRLCATERFVHLKKLVAAYRVYPDSKSFSRSARLEEEWRHVWREYFGTSAGPRGLYRALRQRAMALGLRVRGLGRLPEVYRSPLAFPGQRPPWFWLGVQQLVLPIGAFARTRAVSTCASR